MKKIEIDIQLNPVSDGARWIPEKVRKKGRGSLIIGTNGEFRFVAEEEAIDILDKLSGCSDSDYLGKTDYMIVFNAKKVLNSAGDRYLVGSAMVVKSSKHGLRFIEEDEIEDVIKEFQKKLVTLCGSGIQFTAYELG